MTPALLLAATLAAAEPRSTVILPPQALGIKFDHKLHLEQFELGCTDCHAGAPASGASSDSLIPPESACVKCHEADTDRAQGDCTKCHVTREPPSRMIVPAPNLRFPHKLHVEQGVDCLVCHGSVPAVAVAGRDQLPVMAQCLECHEGRKAPDACATCHLGAGGGRIRVKYPSGLLVPRDHDAGWWKTHRSVARADERPCRACHQEAECADCHLSGRLVRGGAVKPAFHPNDWIVTHGRNAYADDPTCSSCHNKETFCRDCHDGFRASPAGFPSQDRLFHPPGWADLAAGPAHHSHVARRNVTACGSCHVEETCLACHSTRTLAFNPHPAGFAPGRLRSEHRRMCERCHEPDDPLLR